MIKTLLTAAAFSLALVPQANAWNDIWNSIYGYKGNDTGGIIPWSPENERESFQIAERYCNFWNKFPLATSIHRVPGDYIAYKCVWDPPRTVTERHRSRRVNIKIDK